MRILVIGGAGYLGSVLTEHLLWEDHEVTVIDSFVHEVPSLAHLMFSPKLKIVRRDILSMMAVTAPADREKMFKDLDASFDAIVLLAAVVGAGACERDPAKAINLNQTFVEELCSHVPSSIRIMYPCTNSGYGVGGPAECDETSPLKPLSLYGKTKVAGEAAVMKRENSVSLRLATLFGWSPRMRRDLLVNDMVWRALRDRSAVLFEGGFRRNFCHVRDAAGAFTHILTNWDDLRGQVYNVGDTQANMTKIDLCAKIQDAVPSFRYLAADNASDPDKRDYVVSNAKIEATGWAPKISLSNGIRELINGYNMLRREEYGNV